MKKKLLEAKGSSAIPMTPFTESDIIDVQVLEKEIEFICEAGATSICTPVMVSEFMALSEEERMLMIRVPAEVAAGRTALIANVAACNISTAIKYVECAEKHGANAVVAMAPWSGDVDRAGVFEYFRAISKSTSLPIMIQNITLPNVSLSPEEVLELCESTPNIRWVKEEKIPGPVSIEILNDMKRPALEGIMSGFAGAYTPRVIAGGASATIHVCEFCVVVQRIWDLFFDGKEDEARKLHYQLMPAIQLELLYGIMFCKEIMVRRGIFKNRKMRNKRKDLSPIAIRETDAVWEIMKPLLGSLL
jgi:4-hydroxy-tetrahydrodipicolinate synthase